jgi:hypothetical protein
MLLFDRLEDQEDDKVIQILAHMIEIKATSRWAASRCLAHGYKSGVFKRRVSDGLVACASDPDDPVESSKVDWRATELRATSCSYIQGK